MNEHQFKQAVRDLIQASGLDATMPELAATPERVLKVFQQRFLSGYAEDPREILADRIPVEETQNAVLVTGIHFAALCPHHLLPYMGSASVAYWPRKSIVGFGQITRLCAVFTQRLTLQEEATRLIAEALYTHLQPLAVVVVLRAHHACLAIPQPEHHQHLISTYAEQGDYARCQTMQALLGRNTLLKDEPFSMAGA